ncbi:Helitron helicase [Phytophthora megakarya]|uniref:ATP-dependent DNA helicase n=1 Tax=Phytophthora megakarya TaxID=4795 RepID=A0A225WJV3_9STRA|nr:Helitron helicase [Phytophthora megakarya]
MSEQHKIKTVLFQTLLVLQLLLEVSGYAVADFDLPELDPTMLHESLLENSFIRRELTSYSDSDLAEVQRAIYDKIIGAVDHPEQGKKLVFIDGPGGTGKSTLLRNILAKVRLEGKIAITVASSGIAPLLLIKGRMAHSTFKIPLKLNEFSNFNITRQSHLKGLIEKASLIIWDEAPMAHRHAFEAVDRTLRDIMHNDAERFGGKVFVLSAYFRQILPVVKKGTPADTIDSCLKSSTVWPNFQQVLFVCVLLKADRQPRPCVGEGKHEGRPVLGGEYMKLPVDMVIPNPVKDPDEDEEIVPVDVNNPEIGTDEYFANRIILTTTNAVVHKINAAVSDRLPDEAREYLSTDSVEDDVNGDFFEREMLHAVNLNGIPPHKLMLKKGIPIMMMQNLNPDIGLCNGTRLRIVDLKDHVIHATIMTDERRGQHVLIPRIVFISDNDASEFPFRLHRKRFPVQPVFAMTINKTQGQTVQYFCLYLATPCFSHGQQYVALSRVSERSRFKALIENAKAEEDGGVYTENVVYRQIFE